LLVIKGTAATFGALVVFVGAYLIYAAATKSGKRFDIRRVAGIQALDEAVNRCTEMGRPVHFATGTGALDSSMMAAFSVMSYVSSKCAQMDTGLIVSCGLPEIYQISEGVVRQAYVEAGKSEAFKPENVRYLTSAVAAYEIAVDGLLHRENPGANLMFGPFNAEAMMIAERGNRLGLVQISGTNSFLSLARFVATCDYVLIGDELYTAAAYLFKDKEPERLNQVLAQDVMKIAAFLTILVGTIATSLGNTSIAKLLAK
jgi:hypothetical protein